IRGRPTPAVPALPRNATICSSRTRAGKTMAAAWVVVRGEVRAAACCDVLRLARREAIEFGVHSRLDLHARLHLPVAKMAALRPQQQFCLKKVTQSQFSVSMARGRD